MSVFVGKKLKNWYAILGVSMGFTPDELKRAHRMAALQWHPDRHLNASDAKRADAEAKFKEVEEAYTTLSNPESRAEYDRQRAAQLVSMNPRIALRRALNSFHDIVEE